MTATQSQVARVAPFKGLPREKLTPSHMGIQTLISKGTVFKGDLESNSGMKIDGKVIGNLRIHNDNSDANAPDSWLIVAAGAVITGSIFCKKIVICGHVVGLVKAQHVILASTARIDGDIFYDILKISEGAKITGKLHEGEQDKDIAVVTTISDQKMIESPA